MAGEEQEITGEASQGKARQEKARGGKTLSVTGLLHVTNFTEGTASTVRSAAPRRILLNRYQPATTPLPTLY
jgi:hypothetical protein